MTKILYTMKDPFNGPDLKIGKTKIPEVRLGVYQNSYSSHSHVAEFQYVWYGPDAVIDKLEKVLKKTHDWSIEKDGRGHSEWMYNVVFEDIESSVDEIIKNYKFKVEKLGKKFLPVNIHNLPKVLEHIK